MWQCWKKLPGILLSDMALSLNKTYNLIYSGTCLYHYNIQLHNTVTGFTIPVHSISILICFQILKKVHEIYIFCSEDYWKRDQFFLVMFWLFCTSVRFSKFKRFPAEEDWWLVKPFSLAFAHENNVFVVISNQFKLLFAACTNKDTIQVSDWFGSRPCGYLDHNNKAWKWLF